MPSLSTLETLVHDHSFGWPFETLDVFLTGANALDADGLKAKLGRKTRGGWCYELNEWLALDLEAAGFPVRRLLARNSVVAGKPRTHQIGLVKVGDQSWTADAGFGAQTPRRPMLLEDGYECLHDGLPYRMERRPGGPSLWDEPEHWMLRWKKDGEWQNLYAFTLESAPPADLALGNHFHLTNPTSSFADARVVTKPVPGGRLTLVDRQFKTWKNTPEGEVLVSDEALVTRGAYADALETFGLALAGDAVDRLWNREPSVSRGSLPLVG